MPSFLPLFVAAHGMFLNAPPMAAAGTPIHVRLTNAVGTFASRSHSSVSAVLIAPVKAGGETILPAGSLLEGQVKEVRRVGLGVIHEAASLKLNFDAVTLPDGDEVPLEAQLAAVDNAREVVTPHGSIQRWRATGSLSNRAARFARKLILLDVHAQLAVWAVKATILQVPEPEIYLPTGTELTLTLSSPMRGMVQELPPEPRGLTSEERDALSPIVAAVPARTEAGFPERPSDLINVLFIGSRDQVAAAFAAAGWSEPRRASVRSDLASAWAVMRNAPYPRAPMSVLLLNDAPADMNWQKGFDDVSKRHHIRLWEQRDSAAGEQVWAGAATRDTDFAYFRHGQIITHQVATMVDNEREKVASDLAFAGCADAVDWLERPDVPRHVANATGDRMETDGRVLVIRLNDCRSPRRVGDALFADTLPEHGGPLQRVVRRQIMCLRNDFLRTNLYWKSFEGARLLVSAVRRRQVADPDAPPKQTVASRVFPDELNTILSYH
jgi:hypothetical protein